MAEGVMTLLLIAISAIPGHRLVGRLAVHISLAKWLRADGGCWSSFWIAITPTMTVIQPILIAPQR